MKIKKFLSMVLTVMIGLFSCNISFSENMPQMDINDIATPEQMQKMETMLHGVQDIFESLSPEEKEQFQAELTAEIEREQRKLEAMDPEQQKQYIESAFQSFDDIDIDELLSQLEDEDEMIPTDYEPETDKADKTKSTKEEDEQKKVKIKAIIDRINSIIKILESLTEKLGAIKPSAQDKIDTWITKGHIQKWAGPKSNYETFSEELNDMKQKLYKLKEADPKTGKYYYLDDIKKTEKLSGQLDMLHATIKKYEINIEVDDKGTLNESAKSALKRLVNYLVDTTGTIIKSITEITGEFEKKEAPKLKKEEELKAKRAERESRRKAKRPARAKEAGKKDRADRYGGDYWGSSPYGDLDAGYPSASDTRYGDYGNGSGYSDSGSGYQPSSSASPSGSDKKATTDTGKDTTGATPSEKDGKKDGKKITGTPAAQDYGKAIKDKYPKLVSKIESKKKRIDSNLADFDEAWEEIEESANWKNLKQYVCGTATQDPGFIKRIKTATSSLVTTKSRKDSLDKMLKANVKEANLRKGYQNEVQKLIDSRKNELKKIIKKIDGINASQVQATKQEDWQAVSALKDAATDLLKKKK